MYLDTDYIKYMKGFPERYMYLDTDYIKYM